MSNIYGKGLPDLKAIERQGLLAVKIGQVFALRIDFLGQEKCLHLSKLYRQTGKLPPENAIALINTYRGFEFLEKFRKFDEQALASASVGQIHRAELKGGEKVVVKMIKRDFKRQFIRDVSSVRRLVKTAIFFYPLLRKVANPLGILAHIEDYTTRELDLRNEIKGQETLRDIYDRSKGKIADDVLRFPKLYKELSDANVMVAEFLGGSTFDELLEKGELPYEELLKLFYIHGFYMFGPGVFHGDLHPGNVILQDGKIFFIDTSAISRVGDRIRLGLFHFFEALSQYDYETCAEAMHEMSEKKIGNGEFEAFRKKFIELYSDFTDSTVAQVSLTKKMMDTIKLSVKSGMEFEEGMFPIIKSLMYLDGMVLKCKPDAVLVKDMRSFIGEFRALVYAGDGGDSSSGT
jgi:ubiquinone biosynthesis protein